METLKLVGLTGLAGSGKSEVARVLSERAGFTRVAFADPIKRLAMQLFGFSEEQLWGPSEARNRPDPRHVRGTAYMHDWTCTEGVPAKRCLTCDKRPEDLPSSALSGPCRVCLTPRHALQTLGQSLRQCQSDYWVRKARLTTDILLRNPESAFYTPQEGLTLLYDPPPRGAPHRGVVLEDVRHDDEAQMVVEMGGEVWRVERPGAGLKGPEAGHVSEQGLSSWVQVRVLHNDQSLSHLCYRAVQMSMEAPEWADDQRAEDGRAAPVSAVPGDAGLGGDGAPERLKGGGGHC